MPEFSCWTKRKACSDGAETPTNGIPAYNKNSATLAGSVLTSAQSVTVFDFFTNDTKFSKDCDSTVGYSELAAEIDRLNAAIPATTGALKTGVTASAQLLKKYGKYGFTYGAFRALHTVSTLGSKARRNKKAKLRHFAHTCPSLLRSTPRVWEQYILYAGIAGLDSTTRTAICSLNPYSGSLPGVSGCAIMEDFLDYLINGMGRTFAFEAVTIGENVAAGNPSDAYITELTAEQMLWTGFTSKLGKDLDLAPQPGQNLITFARAGGNGGIAKQSTFTQDQYWPENRKTTKTQLGRWDTIVQLGNSTYRDAGARVTHEDAYYAKCGEDKICTGGCTMNSASFDFYSTLTISQDGKGVSCDDWSCFDPHVVTVSSPSDLARPISPILSSTVPITPCTPTH